MKQENKIMTYPKVIWEKDLWSNVTENIRESLAKLQTISNFVVVKDKYKANDLHSLKDSILHVREVLNFVDQKFEVTCGLLDYLIERDLGGQQDGETDND